MIAGLGAGTLAGVAGVLLVGGLVKGVAGFGYAVVGTAALALVVDPATAVVVMIIPQLAANARLIGELDRGALSACARRFWPYVAAAAVGTLLGMALLDRAPTAALALVLGLLTVAYVVGKQPYWSVPGEARLREICFRPGTGAKAGLGFVSGVVFGASNIGVQVVAYLDALDLDHSTFVGVLAMILVGISTLRVGAARWLGLYDAGGTFLLSVAGVVPGLAGVAAGSRLRHRIPEQYRSAGTLALLAVVGVRLTATGIGGLTGA